jgi:enoyl-CoA hydratase
MSVEPEVIIRVEGAVGRLTINRPAALGALTLGMVREMTAALTAWASDPAVELVLLDHQGERGFSAGGDIRALRDSLAGDGVLAFSFFYEEYQLDHLLFEYRKPTCVIMDGVVMGGGSGVALPCRYRVATERTSFAMPETGIGLFPDVGGGWYLSRLPGFAGTWLALTGSRVKAADCLLLGLATDYVPVARIETLKAQILAAPAEIERILTEFDQDPGSPPYAQHEDVLNKTFNHDSVEAVIAALEAEGSEWALAQARTIAGKSPTLSKVALRQMRDGARMAHFADNMTMEFRIAARVIVADDFSEGVRAAIIDMDGAPRWSPSTLAEVSPAMVEAIFAPLPADKEWRPLAAARQ